MVKNIALLGSTGSIGKKAFNISKRLGINIVALAAYNNIDVLENQIRDVNPELVAVYDSTAAIKLKRNINDTFTKVFSGLEGLCEVASRSKADMVLNSVMGMVGLMPTLAAINSGKNIALANKETLVVGGELVVNEAKRQGVKILPVDSEHSAIFQCLEGCNKKKDLKKLILTASGGPFFGKDYNYLKKVKKEDALKHPNWRMGNKITVDSATMMNKGLEIIEAVWLFGVEQENIEVLVHRESVVHSMIEYKDNSIIAQLSVPDMEIPIQYALTYPDREFSNVKPLDLKSISSLSFYEPDFQLFNGINICREAIEIGGTLPAIANGANEEAVKLFLEDKIGFLEICNVVKKSIKSLTPTKIEKIEDILKADRDARDFVLKNAIRVEG